MQIAMPNMPESLTYSIVAAIAITAIAAVAVAIAGASNLAAAVLTLAAAVAAYWLIARDRTTVVTAREAAAALGLLLLVCALADLVTGYPYQAVLFLLAAAALGFAFLLLQQGTIPAELRLGGVAAINAPGGRAHLRMLEELRDAGILTAEEFAAKRPLVET
jgi:Short C-terminal domain